MAELSGQRAQRERAQRDAAAVEEFGSMQVNALADVGRLYQKGRSTRLLLGQGDRSRLQSFDALFRQRVTNAVDVQLQPSMRHSRRCRRRRRGSSACAPCLPG
jgi:hypothetical protein